MVSDEELISTYRESWGAAQQEALEELFRRHQAHENHGTFGHSMA